MKRRKWQEPGHKRGATFAEDTLSIGDAVKDARCEVSKPITATFNVRRRLGTCCQSIGASGRCESQKIHVRERLLSGTVASRAGDAFTGWSVELYL